MQVSAAGGVATLLTTIAGANEIHVFPSFLPDGRHFVYVRAPENPGILVGSLNVKPGATESQPTSWPLRSCRFMRLPQTQPWDDCSLCGKARYMAQSFSVRQLKLVGEPVPVGPTEVGSLFSFPRVFPLPRTTSWLIGAGARQRQLKLTWSSTGRERFSVAFGSPTQALHLYGMLLCHRMERE